MTVKSLTRSSLVNNRWYENMLVGNAAYVPPQPGYEWLETQVLTGTQATVSFSNLNSNYGSTYQHLQIRATGRTTRGGFLSDVLKLEFNTDTTSGNYKYHQLFGNGSTLTSANNPYFSFATAADGSTNLFGAIILDILDPFETTKNKTVRSLAGHTSGSDQTIEVGSMAWFSTAAVTSIQLKSWTGNSWVSGTRFSLYGMRS